MHNILEVRHLSAGFSARKSEVKAVDDVSLLVPEGKIVGIVGESGCGKSMTARAVMGLIRYPGRVISGSVLLDGRELVGMPEKEKRALRGSKNVHDLSGAYDQPEPGDEGGPPGGGGHTHP